MKKIYFLALALVGMTFANAQFEDDFESYSDGEEVFNGHFSSWSGGVAGEGMLVTDDYAADGTLSGAINTDGQDVLLQVGDKFEGIWSLTWDMYIPSGKSAWIGFMEQQSDLSDPLFPLNIYYNVYTDPFGTGEYDFSGQGVVTSRNEDGGFIDPENGVFDIPYDSWATYGITVNLDEMTGKIVANGQTVYEGPWYSGFYQFSGADLWKFGDDWGATGAPCEWYIDNINFYEGELAVSDIQNDTSSIAVYPTVASESFNVSSKSNINQIVVFNTAGQQVLNVKTQGSSTQVNVSTLPSGVYIVKISTDKETLSKKVIVK
ncbi:MAG: T9SS type A sorting domain-containing protein [Moheibacter sp.]